MKKFESPVSRLAYLLWMLIVVLLGLGSRFLPLELPAFFKLYAGDVLWATHLYLLFRLIHPRGSMIGTAFLALVGSVLVECSQLLKYPWLEVVREHQIARLILGSDFLVSDLVCYAVGVLLAFGLDAFYWKLKTNKRMKWRGALQKEYPKALVWSDFFTQTRDYLGGQGFTPQNTLMANVSCRDEVNQYSVNVFANYWGENFNLAGLGGYPSGGLTGFDAYSHHVPEKGNLLVLFGPHIGVSAAGELGLVQRKGRGKPGAACGSLLGFLGKLKHNPEFQPVFQELDPEQSLVEKQLMPHARTILAAPSPTKEITEQMYLVIEGQLQTILSQLQLDIPVIMLGGIFLNTPLDQEDYFAPRHASIQQFRKQSSFNCFDACYKK